MSELRVGRDRYGGDQAVGGELLAVHRLRRRLERVAGGRGPARGAPMAIATANVLRELRELIAALDRRVPQVQRAGEIAIAQDAATLRARALKRIEELERDGER